MEKISKTRVILRAFSGQNQLPEDITEKRREACKTCPFNSANIDEKSLLEKWREKVLGEPFCTLCGCNVKEKTTQPTEYCALRDNGQNPLWNSIILETKSSRDINVLNHNPELLSLDYDPKIAAVILDFGIVSRKDYKNSQFDHDFAFSMICDSFPIIEIVEIDKSCGCTTPKHSAMPDNEFKIEVGLQFDLIGAKDFSKSLTIKYLQNINKSIDKNQPRYLPVRLVGKIID